MIGSIISPKMKPVEKNFALEIVGHFLTLLDEERGTRALTNLAERLPIMHYYGKLSCPLLSPLSTPVSGYVQQQNTIDIPSQLRWHPLSSTEWLENNIHIPS